MGAGRFAQRDIRLLSGHWINFVLTAYRATRRAPGLPYYPDESVAMTSNFGHQRGSSFTRAGMSKRRHISGDIWDFREALHCVHSKLNLALFYPPASYKFKRALIPIYFVECAAFENHNVPPS
jgi:hypothetical protein